MKTINQMKHELKEKIDFCKMVDYEMKEAKGLIKIIIITSDFKRYQEKRIVNQVG